MNYIVLNISELIELILKHKLLIKILLTFTSTIFLNTYSCQDQSWDGKLDCEKLRFCEIANYDCKKQYYATNTIYFSAFMSPMILRCFLVWVYLIFSWPTQVQSALISFSNRFWYETIFAHRSQWYTVRCGILWGILWGITRYCTSLHKKSFVCKTA